MSLLLYFVEHYDVSCNGKLPYLSHTALSHTAYFIHVNVTKPSVSEHWWSHSFQSLHLPLNFGFIALSSFLDYISSLDYFTPFCSLRNSLPTSPKMIPFLLLYQYACIRPSPLSPEICCQHRRCMSTAWLLFPTGVLPL